MRRVGPETFQEGLGYNRIGEDEAFFRMPHFWLISFSAAFALGVIQTLAATIAPLAQDAGISTARAAGLLSLYGIASVAGKL